MKIERILTRRIPFHYPKSEYENATLERLISLFQRHSNNKDLISALRAATKNRNYLAHRVIDHYLEHHETNPKIAREISRKLRELQERGYDLVENMLKELRTIYELDDHVREFIDGRKAPNPTRS